MDVSIICPVFNTDPVLIDGAVRSVLEQTGAHGRELVLVDDRSTQPATREALRAAAAADGRIRVVHQDRNTGPGRARANGIAHASHEWIGFLDSDDSWPADKLDRTQAVLRTHPDARWIGGNYATLLPGGELRPSRRLVPSSPTGDGEFAHELAAPALSRLLVGSWLPLGATLIRKDLIAESGGFDPRLRYGEDWLLHLRLSTLANLYYIERTTYLLNRRGVSMMHSPGRLSSQLSYSVAIARRDPGLSAVRRELRWFAYNTYKDAAMNNALNDRRLRGLAFALRAYAVDPREIGDLALFLRLMKARGPVLAEGMRRYSTSEQVILSSFA